MQGRSNKLVEVSKSTSKMAPQELNKHSQLRKDKALNVDEHVRKVGKFSFFLKRRIGVGHFGYVFIGLLEGTRLVAIKRLQRFRSIIKNEASIKIEFKLLLRVFDHPNILEYLAIEFDENFMYSIVYLFSKVLFMI